MIHRAGRSEYHSSYSKNIDTEVNIYEYNGVYYIIDYAWATFPILTISRDENLDGDYFEYRPFQSNVLSDDDIKRA